MTCLGDSNLRRRPLDPSARRASEALRLALGSSSVTGSTEGLVLAALLSPLGAAGKVQWLNRLLQQGLGAPGGVWPAAPGQAGKLGMEQLGTELGLGGSPGDIERLTAINRTDGMTWSDRSEFSNGSAAGSAVWPTARSGVIPSVRLIEGLALLTMHYTWSCMTALIL